MLSIIWFVFVVCVSLLLLIGLHEFGHYIVAKFFSVPVERFVISPLGGFIQIQKGFVFENVAKFKRACIILAGPVFNLIFAFLAYYLVFVIGIVQSAPVIGNVLPHSLAATAGISSGSEILSIDKVNTPTWPLVIFKVLPHLGRSDVLQIKTTSGEFKIALNNFQLDPVKPNLLSSIGIVPEQNGKVLLRKYSAISAVSESLREVWLYLNVNGIVISKMLTGAISLRTLVGPIGLFSGSFFAAKQGFTIYMAFLGFVSVSLAFVNLLPIPGLDGAQLVYLVAELFRGKPLSAALQMLLLRLGIILLTVLMIQALMNDLLRLL